MMLPDGRVVPYPEPPSEVLLIREDGRVERLCRKHGVGHPVGHVTQWKKWMDVHGCDGCCSSAEFHLEQLQDGFIDI